jgi:hypothetical protein
MNFPLNDHKKSKFVIVGATGCNRICHVNIGKFFSSSFWILNFK